MRATLLVVGLIAAAFYLRTDPNEEFSPSWVATADVAEVAVYPAPGAPEPNLRLASPRENGDPLVLLVDGKEADQEWLPVHLPVRPNGSKGWVRASEVTLARNDFRISIDVDDHSMTLFRRGKVELETPIGVGTESTPTPGGIYYVNELLKPLEPNGLYGPFAYGLSGFSDSPAAANFNGGVGALGIHGTNDPDSIGEDESHGCIRVPNDVITYMASVVPMGTPVEIT